LVGEEKHETTAANTSLAELGVTQWSSG